MFKFKIIIAVAATTLLAVSAAAASERKSSGLHAGKTMHANGGTKARHQIRHAQIRRHGDSRYDGFEAFASVPERPVARAPVVTSFPMDFTAWW